MDDFFWADRFGWTPGQLDELHPERVRYLRTVVSAVDEGRQKHREAEARKQG